MVCTPLRRLRGALRLARHFGRELFAAPRLDAWIRASGAGLAAVGAVGVAKSAVDFAGLFPMCAMAVAILCCGGRCAWSLLASHAEDPAFQERSDLSDELARCRAEARAIADCAPPGAARRGHGRPRL